MEKNNERKSIKLRMPDSAWWPLSAQNLRGALYIYLIYKLNIYIGAFSTVLSAASP